MGENKATVKSNVDKAKIERAMTQYVRQDFTMDQLEEIKLGLQSGIEVEAYAKKDYLAIQMRQIRFGLEQGLDAGIYAKPEFDWFQMEEIRDGLERGIDVSVYAKTKYSYEVMRELKKALIDDINLEKFAMAGAPLIRELHHAVRDKQDILPYIKAGYVPEQLAEIRHAITHVCNIDPYIDVSYRGVAIKEMWLGLEKGLDISAYAKPEYSWLQMREIRLGLESRLDVSIYAKELYSPEQMKEIRLGLEQKLDVEQYKSMVHSATDMRRIRTKLLDDRDAKLKLLKAAMERQKTASGKHKVAHAQEKKSAEPAPEFRVIVDGQKRKALLYISNKYGDLTREQILKLLNEKGVVSGINEELIEKIVAGEKRNVFVTIAESCLPKEGTDGYYQYMFETNKSDRSDIERITWFEKTHTGMPLAIYHKAQKGEDGWLVDGTVLPGLQGKDLPVLSGRGFKLLGDGVTYMAESDGCVTLFGNQLIVSQLLELDKVDETIGNIDYNGAVHIKGDVRGDVKINAIGDVAVDGFVENASIESIGSIFIKNGANGNGFSQFSAAGRVIGKYFENVSITAKDIKAHHYLKCVLSAKNSITSYASICGGTAYAANFIETQDTGNRNCVLTQISLGEAKKPEDNKVIIELKEADKQLAILENVMEEMKKKLPPEVRNVTPMFLKIESAIFTKKKEQKALYEKMQQLEEKKKNTKKSYLKVSGTLYEGTIVTIDGDKLEASTVSDVTLINDNHKVKITKQ